VRAKRRARMPEGAWASQTEGARAKRMAHMSFSMQNLGFQRESARAERRAHVPKVARMCRMGGVQAQGGARMPIGGNACPRERAQAKRKAHNPG